MHTLFSQSNIIYRQQLRLCDIYSMIQITWGFKLSSHHRYSSLRLHYVLVQHFHFYDSEYTFPISFSFFICHAKSLTTLSPRYHYYLHFIRLSFVFIVCFESHRILAQYVDNLWNNCSFAWRSACRMRASEIKELLQHQLFEYRLQTATLSLSTLIRSIDGCREKNPYCNRQQCCVVSLNIKKLHHSFIQPPICFRRNWHSRMHANSHDSMNSKWFFSRKCKCNVN